jgi:hypothetical protein
MQIVPHRQSRAGSPQFSCTGCRGCNSRIGGKNNERINGSSRSRYRFYRGVYGQLNVAYSPVSVEELRQIEMTVGWSEEDVRILGKMVSRTEWQARREYKAKVKKRFVQWVLDACFGHHDQAWLDYQEEIGLRHTPEKKNQTDGAHTPAVAPLRYLIAFGTVVGISTRRFFVDARVRGDELRKLEDAWSKAVQLHIALWSRPYAKDGLW